MSKPEGSMYNDKDSGGAWGDLMLAIKARAVYEANGGVAGIIVPGPVKHPKEVRPGDAVLPAPHTSEPAPRARRIR